LCGIPAEWWVLVKAKYRTGTAQGGLHDVSIQGTHFDMRHLMSLLEKNGSDMPGYKNISDPFK